MKHHYASTMMTKIDKTDITKFGENVEQNELSNTICYWGIDWSTQFEKGSGTFPCNPRTALLGIHPQNENIVPQNDLYKNVHSSLLLIAKKLETTQVYLPLLPPMHKQ